MFSGNFFRIISTLEAKCFEKVQRAYCALYKYLEFILFINTFKLFKYTKIKFDNYLDFAVELFLCVFFIRMFYPEKYLLSEFLNVVFCIVKCRLWIAFLTISYELGATSKFPRLVETIKIIISNVTDKNNKVSNLEREIWT